MLILTRNLGEAVIIAQPGAQPVEIVITEVKGDSVKMAVFAPPEVEVHRREIAEERGEIAPLGDYTSNAPRSTRRAPGEPAPGKPRNPKKEGGMKAGRAERPKIRIPAAA